MHTYIHCMPLFCYSQFSSAVSYHHLVITSFQKGMISSFPPVWVCSKQLSSCWGWGICCCCGSVYFQTTLSMIQRKIEILLNCVRTTNSIPSVSPYKVIACTLLSSCLLVVEYGTRYWYIFHVLVLFCSEDWVGIEYLGQTSKIWQRTIVSGCVAQQPQPHLNSNFCFHWSKWKHLLSRKIYS